MFEAAETGRRITKEEFDRLEPDLNTRLLAVQQEIENAGIPVLVIVSGVEGAGKGRVVNRLHRWLDTRGMRTRAFWEQSDEEKERPRYWRFARALPPRGQIGIFFGSWYTEPVIRHALDEISTGDLDRELDHIRRFERQMVDDGALIVKLWFHLSKKDQLKELKKEKKAGRASPYIKMFSKSYDAFARTSERTLRRTDFPDSHWHIIEATNRRYREAATGFILLDAMQKRLEQEAHGSRPLQIHDVEIPELAGASTTILDHVDLSERIDEKEYDEQLDHWQNRLRSLGWKAREKKRNGVIVFEGWDAAGKGGAIRRITRALDARLYDVIQVAAPTDEEKAHHYLWRFWRHLPRAGRVTIYDRSWYGRVLVERVEGFAREDEWMRAYGEINDFEEHLCEHGILVLKYWMHISAEEQLRRFEQRKVTPHKAWKITDEDWRNREKRGEYESAVNEMVARTSTGHAPWHIVPADDKRGARIEVIRTLCERIEEML